MDLGDCQAPLLELAQWSTIPPVASQVVQRIFMFREYEQLHLRVSEDVLLLQQLVEPGELRLDLSLLQHLRAVHQFPEFLDLFPEGNGVG